MLFRYLIFSIILLNNEVLKYNKIILKNIDRVIAHLTRNYLIVVSISILLDNITILQSELQCPIRHQWQQIYKKKIIILLFLL